MKNVLLLAVISIAIALPVLGQEMSTQGCRKSDPQGLKPAFWLVLRHG